VLVVVYYGDDEEEPKRYEWIGLSSHGKLWNRLLFLYSRHLSFSGCLLIFTITIAHSMKSHGICSLHIYHQSFEASSDLRTSGNPFVLLLTAY
jgi:hypothetical protein